MNITILGGCGFIGSSLAESFVRDGHSVRVFDLHHVDQRNLADFASDITFFGGDFQNIEDVIPAIQDADIVFHLVSTTLPGSALKSPVYDVETNVIPTIRLIDACIEYNARKLVFLSSGGTVYGIPATLPLPEDSPLQPITPYGVSKVTIEKYLALYHYHDGLQYTVLRLSNPYGPRQNPHSGQGVIAAWVDRIRKGMPVEIWGDGEVVRDYLFIEDAIEGIKLAAMAQSSLNTFNIGSGIGYSLNQIYQFMCEVAGRQVGLVYKPTRKVDVPVNILDPELMGKTFGWEPKIDIISGIRRTFAILETDGSGLYR